MGVLEAMWLIELEGESSDIDRLRLPAAVCDCAIKSGPDAKPWLGGRTFERMTCREDVLANAEKTLIRLNGFARMEYPEHCPVTLGDAVHQPDGTLYRRRPPELARRSTGSIQYTFAVPGTEREVVDPDQARYQRQRRIVFNPKLAEILEVLGADNITWQRLRVAFEKINALVGKGDNALVKHGYATQAELTRFKANAEDPRHSGHQAVHGVARGPLKGAKMNEKEGFDFIVRLFNTYVDRNDEENAQMADPNPSRNGFG
jgi:hypothetical protein